MTKITDLLNAFAAKRPLPTDDWNLWKNIMLDASKIIKSYEEALDETQNKYALTSQVL